MALFRIQIEIIKKKIYIYMVYVHHSVLWNCEFLLEHSKCFDFPKTCSSII